ncbi:tetratricopeptide repeat protein [Cerasicoccus maritimus]|uniref:tetratricopeptide repeat protein n=1 Tax=Cerasicoccus maritimus TaxID=490089 RepID=UPI002852975A|nr:tetratricopeptide repeat protein [Cerasicoccus maritimus]
MPKLVIRVALLTTFIAALIVGLWIWRSHTLNQLQEQTEANLSKAWNAQDYSRVRLLAEHLPDDAQRDDWLAKIDTAQLEHAIANSDAYTVRQLRSGQLGANESENEALLLARAAMHERDDRAYASILERWQGEADQDAAWLFLEADALIVAGKIAEARDLLSERQLRGKDESNRLLRLSMLSTDNPREVLRQVDAAVRSAPDHPDALAFRGQILESLGQWQAARADYARALLLAPDSPLFWDQLAEFYRRREQYALAVETWNQGYDKTAVPEFWIKAWFWRRLAGVGPAVPPPPLEGPFVEYTHYLSSLPDDQWWDKEDFAELPYASRILEQRQETFWLRLLQTLLDGNETQALILLRTDPFARRTWAPKLKQAMSALLLMRSGEPVTVLPMLGSAETHQFYQQLSEVGGNAESPTMEFITGNAVWSACFLAEGWLAAAVAFDRVAAGEPDWYVYGQAQARRQIQSVDSALERLNVGSETPTNELLRADLLWLSGKPDEAVGIWEELVQEPDAIGQRAATLLAVHFATDSQWAAVQEIVLINPEWAKTVVGAEMNARLALAKGNLDRAREIYESIVAESMDAKLFLSRLAYQDQDWERARSLTEALILENPDEPAFYQNLNAIAVAEAQP